MPSTLFERRLALPPEPGSVRLARNLVRDLLLVAHRSAWRDAAELAVSELVTNAVLHGHSEVVVTVSVDLHQLRVEVRDANPMLPALRHYDDEATTGRGMMLVEAVTDACGVLPLSAGGKAVWFVLGDEPRVHGDSAEPGAGWIVPEEARSDAGDVVLPGLPPLLWLAACEHEDALLREVDLVGGADHVQRAGADVARTRLRRAVSAALSAAVASGAVEDVPESLDVRLAASPEEADAFRALAALLEAAERTAGQQRLLVPASLPEVAGMRDWACRQVLAQLQGRPATPWDGLDAVARTEAAPVSELTEALTELRRGTRTVVAADEANRILAISPALAGALGWEEAELLGRRVVALVPPRFRQAHVAGFTRHVSTGATRVMGTPLQLPLLHRDGHEVLCEFLLESRRTDRGRALYLAWIAPVAD